MTAKIKTTKKEKASKKPEVKKDVTGKLFNNGSRFSILFNILTARKSIKKEDLISTAKKEFKAGNVPSDDRLVRDRVSKFLANPLLKTVYTVERNEGNISLVKIKK